MTESAPSSEVGRPSGKSSDRFDLTREPWITCRFLDGGERDVSIREALARADDIAEIVGELPTQGFAILRLLVAILYRTLDDELTTTRWRQLWEHGLPVQEVEDYLDEVADRFDLLDPERPFFQVPDLHTAKGEVKDVAPLILDLPSNNRLFTNRAGSGIESLSFAEAARWLVNAQAFDPSGIKSGAVGDERVKGGRGYPIGVAWAGLIGGVFLEGATLRDTLLLNLVAQSEHYHGGWEDDLPPWEREQDGAAERPSPHPHGPVDLATWQSRRIRLIRSGGRIIGSLVANGDRLTPQNLQRLEMMTAWRYSEPQTKKVGRPTYMPREHLPSRAFWRGVGSLLPKTVVESSAQDAATSIPPGVVQWVSRLQNEELLPHDQRVALRAVGVIYGSQSSVVSEIVDDRMLVSLALLWERNADLARDAERAVRLAEDGVWALRNLASNLARAAGSGELELEGPRQRADIRAYSALDEPYRRWLASLDGESEPAEKLREWKATARGILREIGRELIDRAGPSAWVGRERPGRGGTELYTTSRAEAWFLLALHKTFSDSAEGASLEQETIA